MSESKSDESKSDEGATPVVSLVREFCMSNHFEQEFEAFAELHYEDFKDSIEVKDNSEHRLSYYDIYNQYLTKFEGKIEDFLEKVRASLIL